MNIRQYKKKHAICKDDNGKMIYPGDTVEVWLPFETRKPFQSLVYWNMLDGTRIVQQPDWEGKRYARRLSDYLNQEPLTINYADIGEQTEKGYCIKVKSFKNGL